MDESTKARMDENTGRSFSVPVDKPSGQFQSDNFAPTKSKETPIGKLTDPVTQQHSNAQEYKQAILLPANHPSDEFMLPKHERLIMRQIAEVINKEAPISRQLLCKRILTSWNITRLGPKLDGYIESLFSRTSFHKIIHEGVMFFWKDISQMENYTLFRPNSGRDATDLPPEEVANGIKQTLEEQISLPTPDLARLVAQLFGYARMGTNVETAMYQGINMAVAKGYIKVDNGRAKTLSSTFPIT